MTDQSPTSSPAMRQPQAVAVESPSATIVHAPNEPEAAPQASTPPRRQLPRWGEPAPWFKARSPINPSYCFDTVAGRRVVLCFFGSTADPTARQVLDDIVAHRHVFDDLDCSFFGVSTDPQDEQLDRIQEHLPGIHLFWDFDEAVSTLYGVCTAASGESITPLTFVLDERLRVAALIPLTEHPGQHIARVLEALSALPTLPAPHATPVPTPVLVAPRVFETDLCRALIRYYEDRGGEESGFMRDVDGHTVLVNDNRHKRRRDQAIEDDALRQACMRRIHDRLLPEIEKAFQFRATRLERYIVACYDAATEGHFSPHRDNTTKGTAHRRFAVTLNLNSGEYQGGALRFPEFGPQVYQPPTGGAIVFSCSLLHEATPVTQGRRYAFLPFLYDDRAAEIRARNQCFLR